MFIYKHFLDGGFRNPFGMDYHPKLFRSYCRYVGRLHEHITNCQYQPRQLNMEIFHDKKVSWQEADDRRYWDMGQTPSTGFVKESGVWRCKLQIA